MIEEMPTVELRGEEYELEPLGIAAIYKIVDIVQNVGEKVGKDLGKEAIDLTQIQNLPESHQIKIMMMAVKHSENEVYSLLEMILGVGKDELQDAEKFPANTPIKVLKTALQEHPDIVQLKGDLKNLMSATMGENEEG